MMAVMVLAAYMLIVPIVNTLIARLGFAMDSGGRDWADYAQVASEFGTVWGVFAAHLALGTMVLVVWVFMRFVHHAPLADIWSVLPGFRWKYAAVCAGVAVVIVGAVTAWHWVNSEGWAPMQSWGWYLVVIVLTVPLQAVAEEVMFRGYLMQTLGAVVRNEWFAIGATAVIFALFHGVQNPWLFGSRLVFGLVAGVLVWRTGGLEAGIAIHVVNNLCAFGLAVVTGTLVEIRTTTEVGWAQAVGDVGMFVACAVFCWIAAKKLKVPWRTLTNG
jgi:membrane protease YdiL (CAAX protease family)